MNQHDPTFDRDSQQQRREDACPSPTPFQMPADPSPEFWRAWDVFIADAPLAIMTARWQEASAELDRLAALENDEAGT